MAESHEAACRYYGLHTEFRLEDRFGHPIKWIPVTQLNQDDLPEEAQVYFGHLPPTSESPLTLKKPSGIKGIHFDGRMTQLQFEILAVPATTLKTLEVHLWTLAHLTLQHTLVRLDLLTSLKVSSTNFGPKEAETCDMSLVLANAVYLINLNLPKLKYLAISMPTVFSKETVWTQGVVRALVRNRSVKSLNLESPFPVFEESSVLDVTEFEFPPRFEQTVKDLKLTTFHFSVIMPTTSTNFWRKFALIQKTLEYFHFWVEFPGTPFPVASLEEVVKNNRATIRTLAISYLGLSGPEQGPVLNGTVFQNTNLTTLYLIGDLGSALRDPRFEIPSFRFFNLMPYSLETLRLHNILLTLADTKFIANNLQNLKHLELNNIGQEGSFGLSFDNLSTITSKKTLERVEVVAGLNRLSLTVSLEDNGWKNVAKILFQHQRPSTWFRAGRDPAKKTFEMIHENDSENEDTSGEESFTESSASESSLSQAESATPIHEDDMSRLHNSNARKLYGNDKFHLARSSDHVNQND